MGAHCGASCASGKLAASFHFSIFISEKIPDVESSVRVSPVCFILPVCWSCLILARFSILLTFSYQSYPVLPFLLFFSIWN